MNDPSREYYKVYEITNDRHRYDGKNWTYLNLPMDDIKEMAIASLKDSTMMYFSCDVNKFLDSERGLLDVNNYDYDSLFGTTFGMDKKQRIQTHASSSSHAMTVKAVDLDANGKPVKWMVENSWGTNRGYQGHLIMTDEWFNEYMFRLVVETKYAPAKILNMLKQEPVQLPAWDPMYAPEESAISWFRLCRLRGLIGKIIFIEALRRGRKPQGNEYNQINCHATTAVILL